jgi:valyl-tRNA synthetase
LHPFAPFLSEQMWENVPGAEGSILRAPFPKAADYPADEAALREVALLQEAITTVRRIKAETGISPRAPVACIAAPELAAALAPYADAMRDLGAMSVAAGTRSGAGAAAVVGGHDLFVSLEGLIDLDKEKGRLDKELEKTRKSVGFLESRLANEGFVSRAPPELLEKTRKELADEQEKASRLDAARRALG